MNPNTQISDGTIPGGIPLEILTAEDLLYEDGQAFSPNLPRKSTTSPSTTSSKKRVTSRRGKEEKTSEDVGSKKSSTKRSKKERSEDQKECVKATPSFCTRAVSSPSDDILKMSESCLKYEQLRHQFSQLQHDFVHLRYRYYSELSKKQKRKKN